MDQLIEVLLPVIPGLIIAGVALVLGWIKGKGWLKAEFLEQFKTDVSAVVNEVYQEYVKARKLASEDGKLTEDEKKEARRLALEKLKAIGAAKGKDYAKSWLIPVALDLIEKFVTQKKAGTSE